MNEMLASEIIEVTIEKVIYGGDGLARHEGQTIFVPLSAPGDRLRVRIVEARRNYKRAVIEQIIEPSPLRRAPGCVHFGTCGGCQLQHLSYAAQLASKVGFVRESLKRIGHIDWPHPIPIHHAREWGYRARAQFKVAEAGQKLGFYQAGSHQIEEIAECPILRPELNQALAALRTQRAELHEVAEIELVLGESGLSSWLGRVEPKPAVIAQQVGGINYRFDATTFFQVNPFLLETLLETALAEAAGELAVDLYAGVGFFSLPLARQFARVVAVEGNDRAMKYAAQNLKANEIYNVSLYAKEVEEWFKHNTGDLREVDFLLLDPPRTGVQAQVVNGILHLQPTTLVYVSCDPTTLARDLQRLVSANYRIESITALDLFPQTYHVETCVRLKRQ